MNNMKVPFASQTHDTLNKHIVNCMLKFGCWNWRCYFWMLFFTFSSVQGLLFYTLCASQVKTFHVDSGSDKWVHNPHLITLSLKTLSKQHREWCCMYRVVCRILLYLSNRCTIYINNICFLKHSYIFWCLYIVLGEYLNLYANVTN